MALLHTRLSGYRADFEIADADCRCAKRTWGTESQKRPFKWLFSHEKESCRTGILFCLPGYIRVKFLADSSTERAVRIVYFPGKVRSRFILDMDYNIQQQINQVMEVEVNDTVLRGRKRVPMPVFSNPSHVHTLHTDTVQEMTNRFCMQKCS